MSGPSQSVGRTLTRGIQDVSAILPIIGTDQCENHVGSALEGGYFYAATTPLSIFGCLGVVKTGVAVLFSSISIPKVPGFLRKRYKNLPQDRWLDASTLDNAGFKLQGSVAPLIGIDNKKRFKTETRLLQILEEKYISIEWKSPQWNDMLALSTLVAAAMSISPYIALLSGSTSWRPTSKHALAIPCPSDRRQLPCGYFLSVPDSVLSHLYRLLFMTIHRRLIDNMSKDSKYDLESWLKEELGWDAGLHSEQCIWRLERFLSSEWPLTKWDDERESSLHSVVPWFWSPSTLSSSIYSKLSRFWSRITHKDTILTSTSSLTSTSRRSRLTHSVLAWLRRSPSGSAPAPPSRVINPKHPKSFFKKTIRVWLQNLATLRYEQFLNRPHGRLQHGPYYMDYPMPLTPRHHCGICWVLYPGQRQFREWASHLAWTRNCIDIKLKLNRAPTDGHHGGLQLPFL